MIPYTNYQRRIFSTRRMLLNIKKESFGQDMSSTISLPSSPKTLFQSSLLYPRNQKKKRTHFYLRFTHTLLQWRRQRNFKAPPSSAESASAATRSSPWTSLTTNTSRNSSTSRNTSPIASLSYSPHLRLLPPPPPPPLSRLIRFSPSLG